MKSLVEISEKCLLPSVLCNFALITFHFALSDNNSAESTDVANRETKFTAHLRSTVNETSPVRTRTGLEN